MDQLAYKATKAMVGYKVNSISKSVKDELGFGEEKKNEESEYDKQKRLVLKIGNRHGVLISCILSFHLSTALYLPRQFKLLLLLNTYTCTCAYRYTKH